MTTAFVFPTVFIPMLEKVVSAQRGERGFLTGLETPLEPPEEFALLASSTLQQSRRRKIPGRFSAKASDTMLFSPVGDFDKSDTKTIGRRSYQGTRTLSP